jgi:hypothetical protein
LEFGGGEQKTGYKPGLSPPRRTAATVLPPYRCRRTAAAAILTPRCPTAAATAAAELPFAWVELRDLAAAAMTLQHRGARWVIAYMIRVLALRV